MGRLIFDLLAPPLGSKGSRHRNPFQLLLASAQDFVAKKCDNMIKAWTVCNYKHSDLRREFLEAPVATKRLNYLDPESVQKKWLDMLEAHR